MKNLVAVVIVVGIFISTAMWINYNLEAIILLPTIFSIPVEIYLLWVGILVVLGCIFIVSLPTDKKEIEKKREERLERAERIMCQHQADVANGRKRRLQTITLSK